MARRSLSVWWSSESWDSARSAHLADLPDGRAATLVEWITLAVVEHASRTPDQRAELGEDETPAGGFGRVLQVDAEVIAKIGDAMVQDQRAGRNITRSAWVREAVAVAAAATRERAGGQLPPPPRWLPRGPRARHG